MGRRERDSESSRLRNARRQGSQTLTQFARTVGYSPSYLSAVELGHLPETEQIVLAYEAALGMTPGTLAEGKQSVARVLNRVRAFEASSSLDPVDDLQFPEGRLVRHPRREVMRGILSLLRQAAASKLPPSTIYVTTFGKADDFAGQPLLQRQWDHALWQLVRAGWSVTHLLRLDDDVDRSLRLIESMFSLLWDPGRYRPVYSPQRETLAPSQDFLVIPGLAALIRFGGQDSDRDATLLLKDGEAIASLAAHCEALAANSHPLVRWLNRDDRLGFEKLLGEVEELPGERMLVRDSIGYLPRPEDGLESAAGWPPGSAGDGQAEGLDAVRRRRRENFLSHIERYRYRDIAIKGRLEQAVRTALLVKQGLILSEGGDRFSPENVLRLVDHAVSNLKTLPGYELALLDDSEVGLIQPAGSESVVYWLVKGGQAVFLETWYRGDDGESHHLHFAVLEASIAGAFAEHFRNVWNRVASRNRDRTYVIAWLERLVGPLRFG